MTTHPSEFIRDECEARGWDSETFARHMMLSVPEAEMILSGEAWIGDDTASRLGYAFGTSARLWRNLQAAWDREQEGIPRPPRQQ